MMNELPNDELLSAYLDGELSAADRAAVERHLAESPDSRQLLEELKAIGAGVRALPRHRLDADFGQRVLRRAERQMLVDPVAAASPPAGSPFAPQDARPRPASAAPSANGATQRQRRLWHVVVWPCAAFATAAALLIAVDPFGFRQVAEHQIAGVDFDRAADMPAPANATPTEGREFERLARSQPPRSGEVDRAFGADGAEFFAKSQAGAGLAPGGMGGGGVGGAAGAYANAATDEPMLLVMLDVREGADPQQAISRLFADANIQLADEMGPESTLGRSSSGRHRFSEPLAEDEMDRSESATGKGTTRDNRESDIRELEAAAGEGLGDESGLDGDTAAERAGETDAEDESDELAEDRPADKLAMDAIDPRADAWEDGAQEFYFEVKATPDQLQALIRDAQSQTAWFAASEFSLTGSGPVEASLESLSTANLGALPADGPDAGGGAMNVPGAGVPAAASGAIEPPPAPPLPAPAEVGDEPAPAPAEEARSDIPKGEARSTPDAPERPSPSEPEAPLPEPKAPRSDPAPRFADGEQKDSGRPDRSRRMSTREGGVAKKAEKRLSATASDNTPTDDTPTENAPAESAVAGRGARLHGELRQQSSEVADQKQDSVPMGGARRLAELPESLRGRTMYRAPAARKETAGAPAAGTSAAAELHDANAATESFNFVEALPIREDLEQTAADIASTTAPAGPPVPRDAVPPAAVPGAAPSPDLVQLEMAQQPKLAEGANDQAPTAPATVRAIIVVRVPPPIAAGSRDESKASPAAPADPVEPAAPEDP